MTPYYGVMGRISRLEWLANARKRRTIFAIVILLLAVLTVFPRPYRAVVTMTPADQTSGGLAAAAGTVGAFAGLVGSQQIVDVLLKLSRGMDVRQDVIDKLDLGNRWGTHDNAYMMRKLDRIVTLSALRGSMIEVEAKTRDPEFGLALVKAYSDAMRNRVGIMIRNQTMFKRQVLQNRFHDAIRRKMRAEAAMAAFSRKYGMPSPDSALNTAAERLPSLRNQLRDKQSQLEVMRQFQTDEAYPVQTTLAEISEIERQIKLADRPGTETPQSVDWVIDKREKYEDLQNELDYAQDLFDSYKRLIDGTTFEDLVSNGSLRIIEQPYLDPDYQFNLIPLCLLLVTTAFAAAFEFYLFEPKRRLRNKQALEADAVL